MVTLRSGKRTGSPQRANSIFDAPHEGAQQLHRAATAPGLQTDQVMEEAGLPAGSAGQPALDRSLQFSRARQTQSGLSKREVSEALLSKLPASWQEREMPCAKWRKYDKAFACTWLTDRMVVLGTKCNHTLVLDVVTAQVREVPLPRPSVQRPVAPELQTAQAGAGSLSPPQHCGNHAVSLSPDGRYVATGGGHVNDAQVFEVLTSPGVGVNSTELAPVTTLVEHADWVFGIAWVTTSHLVTGSRDKTIKLWQLNEDQSVITQPLQTVVEKAGKVRDVKYLIQSGRLASLAVDGTCHFWDPHLTSVSKVHIRHSQEVVCLGANDSGDLLAAGSHSHVTLLDPRAKRPVKQIGSQDPHHGVRSVTFHGHLLSSGSGHGKLSFYDLRAGGYLQLDSPSEPRLPRDNFTIGAGWLKEDHIYRQYFQDAGPLPNACYAHAWDPTGTRMFCAGGPLAFGLKGVYMGLWA